MHSRCRTVLVPGIPLQPSPQLNVYIQVSSSSFEDVATIALGEHWVLRAAYGNLVVSAHFSLISFDRTTYSQTILVSGVCLHYFLEMKDSPALLCGTPFNLILPWALLKQQIVITNALCRLIISHTG